MMTIKDIVKNDNVAEFAYYRDGSLWYKVNWVTIAEGPQEFIFPVPIDDIGNATFSRVERAMLMMRYIRKHLKVLDEAKEY
jgi:hypothetical protein